MFKYISSLPSKGTDSLFSEIESTFPKESLGADIHYINKINDKLLIQSFTTLSTEAQSSLILNEAVPELRTTFSQSISKKKLNLTSTTQLGPIAASSNVTIFKNALARLSLEELRQKPATLRESIVNGCEIKYAGNVDVNLPSIGISAGYISDGDTKTVGYRQYLHPTTSVMFEHAKIGSGKEATSVSTYGVGVETKNINFSLQTCQNKQALVGMSLKLKDGWKVGVKAETEIEKPADITHNTVNKISKCLKTMKGIVTFGVAKSYGNAEVSAKITSDNKAVASLACALTPTVSGKIKISCFDVKNVSTFGVGVGLTMYD